MTLQRSDLELRGLLTRKIAELGLAPDNAALAAELGASLAEAEASLQRLHDAHALLLHPGTTRPWVVHPFALSPGGCWVASGERGWWANCLYCGLGIAAATGRDADITCRLGGEAQTVVVQVRGGQASPPQLLFHLSTPVRHWWDNVIHACASFQPFRDEAAIDGWVERHGLPRGAVMTVQDLAAFARDWYGDYIARPWRKRSREETLALFERHGLTGEFWSLP